MIMNTRVFAAAALILSGIVAITASAEVVVRRFEGTESQTTAEFQVRAPWVLDWQANGEYEQMLGFQVTLLNGRDGRNIGQVVKVTDRGNGVRMFNQSGRYRLRIDSTLARWQIKIVELTADEAKLYKPKTASQSPDES